ncbi:uncharacterized protein ACLA_002200 [Aspergillus clavatus NRRL 1]|uniref:Uncharacterized protein n=1 Tax=Aspergillus clavatus (strain ATCC 1007 / CBS 513.65 / DSM 816 / NCTC 3887 / NRRL 1 / QM 1276 / 107) TaxID=344612 RepID=A1C541_ASPCL|nr:uncharacterized protein ACLA_002200 [Aspergillus clavatus NRRL 1]EAW14809.1 hypothetical protein ACLA_002200 [Aspergillus clavatus NRRL 1]
MPNHHRSLFLTALLAATVAAIPQSQPTQTPSPSPTSPPASTITTVPSTTCPPGSTLHTTTDCTLGFPVTYCHSPIPLTTHCPSGYFPGLWSPGHCEVAATCYAVDSPWITTSCSHGGIPWSTSTLYSGILEGETTSTTISIVSCSCASDQYYSATSLPGRSTYDNFCMPSSKCPSGMTSTTSTNEYCVTATAECATWNFPTVTESCYCANPSQTAVYPSGDGAVATGCAAI